MATRTHSESQLTRIVVTLGGETRAANKGLYEVLFPHLSPTKTAHAAIDRRVAESRRIEGQLTRLADDHPVRVAHLAEVDVTLAALTAAKGHQEEVDVTLALARSRLTEFKYAVDTLRTSIHGRLVTITTVAGRSRHLLPPVERRQRPRGAPRRPPGAGSRSRCPTSRGGGGRRGLE